MLKDPLPQGISTKNILRAGILALSIINLSSCTTLRVLFGVGFEKPKVELQNVKIEKASLKQIELNIFLKIHNPNDFQIELKNIRYAISSKEKNNIARGT